MKASLLEKKKFELRGQRIGELLIIKQLKANSKSNPFTTDASTPTNKVIALVQTNDSINSNNDNNDKKKFELRGQRIGELLIIKQLKANSKSNPFTTDASTPTNKVIALVQTNDSINSNNDNNNNNSSKNNSINNNN